MCGGDTAFDLYQIGWDISDDETSETSAPMDPSSVTSGSVDDMSTEADGETFEDGDDTFDSTIDGGYAGGTTSMTSDLHNADLIMANLLEHSCDWNTFMCCWTERTKNEEVADVKDNTDVCSYGDTQYPGDSEGQVHCHGFVWAADADDEYIAGLAGYVMNHDHMGRRGYHGSIPGAPMCGCLEDMPVVSKADCSRPRDTDPNWGKACTRNDLKTRYKELYDNGRYHLYHLNMMCNSRTFALCAGPLLTAVAVAAMANNSRHYEHLGCYHDNKDDRVMDFKIRDKKLTTDSCYDYCVGEGAFLMATQWSKECWCGNSLQVDYDRHGDDAVCEDPCAGDETVMCGGDTAFDLYQIGWDISDDETSETSVPMDPSSVTSGSVDDISTEVDGETFEDDDDPSSMTSGSVDDISTGTEPETDDAGSDDETSETSVPMDPSSVTSGSVDDISTGTEPETFEDDDDPSSVASGSVDDISTETEAETFEDDDDTFDSTIDGGYAGGTTSMTSDLHNQDLIMANLLEHSCDWNTFMCCWTKRTKNEEVADVKDNTDVCSYGDTQYPGDSEGQVHCHGFVWAADADDEYIAGLAGYVMNHDHMGRRGYHGSIPDAPICGCLEDMPVVSKADCSRPRDTDPNWGKACTKNDLKTRYKELYDNGDDLPNLVWDCEN
eukprot:g13893.t1